MSWSLARRLVLLTLLIGMAVSCDFQSGPGRRPAGSAPLPPLSTRGRWIVDRDGRTVILRGVNYNGMESMLFTDQPPELADFQQLRRWGFNVIRFPLSWDWIEPAPGVYDETYLRQWVDPVLDYADQAGVGVILEVMHQWNWSTCFDAGGRGNGAPKWALPLWAQELCPGAYSYGSGGETDSYNQVSRACADFWLDMGAREDLMKLWEMMVRRYHGHPAVVAYDLFNEPNPGDVWAAHPAEFDRDILQPFHEQLIRRIRAIDPDKLIIYECSIMHDLYDNQFTAMPFPNLVYSTHLYSGGTSGGTSGYNLNSALLLADVQRSVAEAEAQGVPLFVGEFGIGMAADNSAAWMRDEFHFQELYLVGSTWWSMRQHNNNAFGLTDFDTRAEKPGLLDYVSRPYPAATAGELMSFSFDEATKSFTMTFANDPRATGETLISIPPYQYAGGIRVECSDPAGQWAYTYDGANGILHVTVSPSQPVHTINVFPS